MKKRKQLLVLLLFSYCAVTQLFAQMQDTAQAAQYLLEANERIDSLDYKKAILVSEKAIQIYKKIDAQYYRLGYAYNIKGDVYYEMGQYEKAIAYFLNAKDILWMYYEDGHLEIAQSFNYIGLCYWKEGALDRALDYFKEGLELRERLLGPMHSKVADSYNNLGNIALDQRDLTNALAFYQKSLSIREQVLGGDHLDVASSYNNIGSCFRYAGQYENAIEYFNKSLNIRRLQLGEAHPKTAQSYLNMGDCYNQMGKIEESLSYYNRSLAILQKHYDSNHLEIGNVYNNLGNCYSKMGNNAQALDYFEKALSVQLTHYQEDSPNLIPIYNNLANIFDKQGDYQKAMVYYENNLHILNTNSRLGESHPYTAFTYNNIGLIQTKFENYQAALDNYSKALAIYYSRNDRVQIAETLNSIGTCFLQHGTYQEAIQNFTKSLALFKEINGKEQIAHAVIYQNLGNCYFNQQEYALSLENYQKALKLVVQYYGTAHPILAEYKTSIGLILQEQGDFSAANQEFEAGLNILKIDPSAGNSPDFIDAPIEVLRLLNAKADTHLAVFCQNKKKAELQEALHLFDYAIAITKQLGKQYQEVQSKRLLGEISYESYKGAISSCYQLYLESKDIIFIEKAFNYSEQSRSNLVLEALNKSEATSFSGIPDSLIKKENDLKISITFYEKKKREATVQSGNTNIEIIDNYNNKIFTQKKAYQRLIKQFEVEFPKYFQYKYAAKSPSIKEIQNELLTIDESLIEYFIADSSIYVFVINQDSIFLKEIIVDSLLEKVSLLGRSIIKYYTNTGNQTGDIYLNSLKQYTGIAYSLYQKLIEPIQAQLSKKIIIINGGILNFVPFEALLASPVEAMHKPKNFDYLLKYFEISYSYSATLLHRINQRESTKFLKKLLAFAPEFLENDRRKLAPLSNNIPEVKGIESLIEGDVFIGKEATKQKFIALATQYQIIHLSAHGKSNADFGDYSYLAFSENRDSTLEDLLYAKDIYNLSLNADMVVLSACETGQGEFYKSEGMVSMGRAFFYSGAKSILNTLWSVDDASTSQLIRHFYEQINEGADKSAALRKAKLSLIEEGEYAHPFYWSAFMLIGDSSAIDRGMSGNWWIPLVFLVVGLIGFFFFRYRA